MTDDPEVPKLPEPAGETPPGERSSESAGPDSGLADPNTRRLGLSDGESGQKRSAGSLLRRITGPLQRSTGLLSEPEQTLPGFEGRLELGDAEEIKPPEKSKPVTGQLGSIITGILRGTQSESEPPAGEQPPPLTEIDEFVSELRQDLVSDEASQSQHPKATGALLQTLTGSLKQVTAPLKRVGQLFHSGKTGQLDQPEADPDPAPPQPFALEVEDDIIADRLSTTSIAEPAAWVEPEDIVIEFGLVEEESDLAVPQALGLDTDYSQDQEISGQFGEGVDPVSMLDDETIAEPDQADEKVPGGGSQQAWLVELRKETADQEAGGDQDVGGEKPQSASGRLLSVITGFLRRSDEAKTDPIETQQQAADLEESKASVSDDIVSSRLDRSLGIQAEEESPADHLPGPLQEGDLNEQDLAAQADEDALLQSLESRFDQLYRTPAEDAGQPFSSFEESGLPDSPSEVPAQPYTSFSIEPEDSYSTLETGELHIPFAPGEADEQPDGLTLSPEDEQLIWGDADSEPVEDGRTIRAEDFWNVLELSQTQDQPPVTDPGKDAFGENVLPELEPPEFETRLHQVTEPGSEPGQKEPFEDIRSIVLEDAPEVKRPQLPSPGITGSRQDEDAHMPVSAGFVAVEQEAAEALAPAGGWKTRLANLTLLQKIILVEAVAVVIALVIATPYFIRLIQQAQAPVEMAPANFQIPRALPEGVPYPTGVMLPGGWFFNLDKSTFVDGQWKPDGGEWLEGTELRRVVALPWNPQTEAVVQSFQPGDTIELYLKNDRSIQYEITQIDRVAVDEIQVYTDLRPSLAVILYREDSDQRWVVVGHRWSAR